ncbi:hypothetical protein JHK85_001268 [Glycine max]|nr:hypothetical protein JHK85_001268 [Glycine max]
MVNHKGEQTKFLIWDRECAQLIGQLADDVNRLKIEDGDVDLNASPQALDRLLGCFLAFKVKVQPRFRNSVVLKYSDESDLINAMLDMIPDSEQSLSITAEHDRSMLGSSEPTKFESQLKNLTLLEIEKLLHANQKSLRDYPTMPYPEGEILHRV